MVYQIFGSKSSVDTDIMVFVDSLGNINDNHKMCSEYSKILSQCYSDVNLNLAILRDGYIVEVFKGLADECNNSLHETYGLHEQEYPLMIKGLVTRDVESKIHRSLRHLLTNLSRTEYRSEVKLALRSSYREKIDVLSKIDFSKIKELNKKLLFSDYLKVVAFQMGQTLGLVMGKELYSKSDISEEYPELEPFLFRHNEYDLRILEYFKHDYLEYVSRFDFTRDSE
jgi:hypothetical protein